MNEAEVLAHALCDYLRPVVSERDMAYISRPLQCGEAEASLVEALGVAIKSKVGLPPIFGEKILSLPELNSDYVDVVRSQLRQLPDYWQVAS